MVEAKYNLQSPHSLMQDWIIDRLASAKFDRVYYMGVTRGDKRLVLCSRLIHAAPTHRVSRGAAMLQTSDLPVMSHRLQILLNLCHPPHRPPPPPTHTRRRRQIRMHAHTYIHHPRTHRDTRSDKCSKHTGVTVIQSNSTGSHTCFHPNASVVHKK